MRTLLLTLSLCLIAALAACRTGDETPPPAQETQQPRSSSDVAPPAPVELTAEGELKSVDMNTKTLVVKDSAGGERTFSFSDSTGIIGAPGAQGLSGKQGSRVKIGYVTQVSLHLPNRHRRHREDRRLGQRRSRRTLLKQHQLIKALRERLAKLTL
jgi:hypothetical protein